MGAMLPKFCRTFSDSVEPDLKLCFKFFAPFHSFPGTFPEFSLSFPTCWAKVQTVGQTLQGTAQEVDKCNAMYARIYVDTFMHSSFFLERSWLALGWTFCVAFCAEQDCSVEQLEKTLSCRSCQRWQGSFTQRQDCPNLR